MIRFEKLKKEYGDQVLFEDVFLQMERGERWGIVGRNGTGKTTLFRLMTGEETLNEGAIHLPKNYRIGYLQQHRKFQCPTLLEEAALGLSDPSETHLHYQVEMILFGLGFKKEDLTKSPYSFSGGYQLRIQLAQVFVSDPDCLILDEPTNYLDIVSIRWLIEFLQQWSKEMMIISHDRQFLDSFTTHTVGIHRKRIRKVEGGTEKFYTLMSTEEEVQERTRQKIEKKKAHMQSYVERFGAKATKAAQAQSRLKAIDKLPILEKLIREANLNFSFNPAPFGGKKLGEARHVHFDYAGNTSSPLIQDCSLLIEPKSRIAIIGKNGRGKSTLLRLLAQELTPLSGSVSFANKAELGVFGQTHVDTLKTSQTVEEAIAGANPQLRPGEVRTICGWMFFSGDLAKKRIEFLSGGEKSRVVLGRILATPANLLLLDEPTHHLDIESIEALMEAMESFPGAVILVTHSEEILRRFQPQICIVFRKGGHHLFLGDYDDFLRKEGWEEESPAPKKEPKEEKADRMQQREQTRSLEREIQKIERRIEELNNQLKNNEHALAQASVDGNFSEIHTHSKKQDELEKLRTDTQKKWEDLYREWEDRG